MRNRWSVEKRDPAAQPFNTLSVYTQGGDADWVADTGGFAHSGEGGQRGQALDFGVRCRVLGFLRAFSFFAAILKDGSR